MDELISRQAAMDALNHELRCGAVINQCGLEVAYEVIEDLPPAEPHWILISQELPKVKQRVIVTCKDGSMAIRKCNDAGHLTWFYSNIKAWMPAPEPYKEEELRENGIKIPKNATDTNAGDTISRQAVKEMLENHRVDFSTEKDYRTARACVNAVPPAQQNLSEEYAKAVRNWLVNYQIKCAELKGRYTPYEVLGWIVSDWRKENGIW